MAGLLATILPFALLNLIQKGLLASGAFGYNPVHLKNAIRL